jgi:hypothetical protein
MLPRGGVKFGARGTNREAGMLVHDKSTQSKNPARNEEEKNRESKQQDGQEECRERTGEEEVV